MLCEECTTTDPVVLETKKTPMRGTHHNRPRICEKSSHPIILVHNPIISPRRYVLLGLWLEAGTFYLGRYVLLATCRYVLLGEVRLLGPLEYLGYFLRHQASRDRESWALEFQSWSWRVQSWSRESRAVVSRGSRGSRESWQ